MSAAGHPSTYHVELSPPDLTQYEAGSDGLGHVMSYDSGRPGPHVVLVAVVHGNEICGAIALDRILRNGVRPDRGRLTFVFANVAAYQQFDPRHPEATRYVDEDFNRIWSTEKLNGPASSIELDRARDLLPLIDSADLLLDLHSMQHSSPPLALAGPHLKGLRLARRVGIPDVIVMDEGHTDGTRLRDYGDFGDPTSPRNALLIECGQHWEASSANFALSVCYRFLACAGTIDERHAPDNPSRKPQKQRVIQVTERVTVKTDSFRFTQPFVGLECIPEPNTVIAHDKTQTVRTPYANAVLVMPSRRLAVGQTAVRIGREVDA